MEKNWMKNIIWKNANICSWLCKMRGDFMLDFGLENVDVNALTIGFGILFLVLRNNILCNIS